MSQIGVGSAGPSGWFAAGAVLTGVGVGLGAIGAHALRARLAPDHLATFETGVRYHLIHGLALLAVAWAGTRWPGLRIEVAGWAFALGILFFSGSLYLLSVTGARWLGLLTPIGGVGFLLGWAALAYAALAGR